MTAYNRQYPAQRQRRFSRWLTAAPLAFLLAACGGGTPDNSDTRTPAAQKGFGPTELYHPSTNPNGRILQSGDTGIVILSQTGNGPAERQVWFEIADDSLYAFEMEDEDLALLSRVELGDASGKTLLSVDASQREASATLSAGRYALRLVANPAHPDPAPLFIRFDDDAANDTPAPSGHKNKAGKQLTSAANGRTVSPTFGFRSCVNCNLTRANLTGAFMYQVNFEGANLTRAELSKTNMGKANLESAILDDTDLSHSDLSEANLSKVRASGASFYFANLYKANLEKANLQGSDLFKTELREANLNDANLYNAIVSEANMQGAKLRNADLRNANLLESNLKDTDLTGANLSGALWPYGDRVCAPDSIGVCQ